MADSLKINQAARLFIVFCYGYCLSCISAYFWHSLPCPQILRYSIATLCILLLFNQCICLRWSFVWRNWIFNLTLLFTVGLLCGALQVASLGYSYLSWQLPSSKIQQDVTLTGQVISSQCDFQQRKLGEINGEVSSFFHRYVVGNFVLDDLTVGKQWKLSLSESTSLHCFQPGDTIEALVRIKPSYATANPVGFSGQRFYASKGIVATGYIKHRDTEPLQGAWGHRTLISSFLNDLNLSENAIFQALLLGNRQYLTPQHWSVLQKTGTSHVFSISGMHLGIVAMGVGLLCGGLLVLSRFFRFPIVESAISKTYIFIVVAITSGAYAWLSGLGIPVIRAWCLLLVAVILAIARVTWRPHQIGVVMLGFCITLNPLSVLDSSLYLSVIAVFLVWLLYWRFALRRFNWLSSLVILQLALSVMIVPITLLWFGTFSVSSVIANLVVVPLVTLFLPLGLFVFLTFYWLRETPVSDLFSEAMSLLNWGVKHVMTLLQILSDVEASSFSIATFTAPLLSLIVFLVMIVVIPNLRRWWVALPLLAPVAAIDLPSAPTNWYVHVLDVGQGTAVIVNRGSQAILVDTGPSYNQNPVIANIIPAFFDRLNINKMDYVIVSHDDLDHSGGSEFLLEWFDAHHYTPRWISPVNGCEQGREIQWNGLSIRFLWPLPQNRNNDNASSCVVHISDGNHSALFPGDIGRTSEYAILTKKVDVKANVMLSAHHGSSTSSTNIWVKRVAPDAVIHTQGYENRWQFPHQDVVETFEQNDVKQYLMSESGYIRISFKPQSYSIETFRNDLLPRWYLRALAPRHLYLGDLKK